MSESEVTVELSKKRKRNEEEEGQDQVLSFRELKLYFDKKFEDKNKTFSPETKHLAKRLKKPAGPSFNYKGTRIQHEFKLNLTENMEVLIPLIRKGPISRTTKAVKNMIDDLEKRNKLMKISGKSPPGWNTVREYLSDDLARDSEDDKKLKAAEARALRKQKIKVTNNSISSFRQINTRD